MEKNLVAVRRERASIIVDIIRLLLQHSCVEYDGPKHTVRVKYSGPNGWNVMLNTSFDTAFAEAKVQKIVQK